MMGNEFLNRYKMNIRNVCVRGVCVFNFMVSWLKVVQVMRLQIISLVTFFNKILASVSLEVEPKQLKINK